jgi:glucose/arabinose dehydrogenase
LAPWPKGDLRGSAGGARPIAFLVAVAALAVAVFGCGGRIGAGATASGHGAGEAHSVHLDKLGDFHEPLYITQPPITNNLLFVIQKAGQIRVVRDGEQLDTPFLDLRDRVQSGGVEQGLLSLAFAPDYQASGLFYVSYTGRDDNLHVAEFRRQGVNLTVADPSSARQVLKVNKPAAIHNGGLLLFGPDEKLYVGVGDGGPAEDPHRTGQRRQTFLGKILRIDPRSSGSKPYTVPTSNPFTRDPGWDEIFAYGLRNPWRFSFDRKTGDFLIGDVGQDVWEEIDFRRPGRASGANFGWSAYEGRARYNRDQKARNSVRPILVYKHKPACSVTGGYVVRDKSLPSLYGRYIYGDFCTGEVRSLVPDQPKARDDRALGIKVPTLASFGEDNRGNIYAVSLNGPVYRLVDD